MMHSLESKNCLGGGQDNPPWPRLWGFSYVTNFKTTGIKGLKEMQPPSPWTQKTTFSACVRALCCHTKSWNIIWLIYDTQDKSSTRIMISVSVSWYQYMLRSFALSISQSLSLWVWNMILAVGFISSFNPRTQKNRLFSKGTACIACLYTNPVLKKNMK